MGVVGMSWQQEEAVLLLDVEGMKCAGCSGAVQRLLSAQVRLPNPNPASPHHHHRLYIAGLAQAPWGP